MNLDLKNFCWRLFGTKQQVIYLEDLFFDVMPIHPDDY